MIIKVDNINSKHYEKVFQDAYETLLALGKVEENEVGRFRSLEEFFSKIQDIYQADSSFLIKLPVDEPALAIDANKRTIDTTLFNKCANVQSDEVAEIAVFSIDRYFDYMDLATTEIWVQWTAPGADGKAREGATLIELKDVETEPGKVRFGWPLDSDITAVPGKVQFAVRMFKRGDVTVQNLDGTTSTVNKIVYSYNTLPATLTIASALQPELNPETELNKPQSLFAYSIVNSLYTGEDMVVPQTPTFGAPGLDLPVTATLHENTLTLRAQAIVGDTGTVRYEWYYTSATGDGIAKNVEDIDFGTVGIAYSEIDGSKEVLSERYYTKDAGDTDSYSPYYGTFPVAEGVTLYEKFTTFTVPATGDVTGTYQVKAINNNGTIDGNPQMSYPCILVSPSEIVIKEDLPLIDIMTVPEGGTEASTTLKIVVDRKASDNSVYTYDWLKKTVYTNDLTSIDGFKDSNTLEVKEPGWYSVNIHSDLNRQTNELASEKVTKVTFAPTAPVVSFNDDVYDQSADDSTANLTYLYTHATIAAGTAIELTFDAVVNKAGDDPDLYGIDNLYSEGLSYNWTITRPDETPAPLLNSEISAGSEKSNSITVLKSKDVLYTCTVTNSLNGETASSQVVFHIL